MTLLLDLFCGGGGAGEGYGRAGYEVVGVDHNPHPSYPYEFIQADAIDFLVAHGSDFEVIHASPPCQGYSFGSNRTPVPRLINTVRKLLPSGIPHIIENVMGARDALFSPTLLCGFMFDLHICRHRLFETNFKVNPPIHFNCHGKQTAYAKEMGWDEREMSISRKIRGPESVEKYHQLLGVKHRMTVDELAEAVPPTYTEFLGLQLRSKGEAA